MSGACGRTCATSGRSCGSSLSMPFQCRSASTPTDSSAITGNSTTRGRLGFAAGMSVGIGSGFGLDPDCGRTGAVANSFAASSCRSPADGRGGEPGGIPAGTSGVPWGVARCGLDADRAKGFATVLAEASWCTLAEVRGEVPAAVLANVLAVDPAIDSAVDGAVASAVVPAGTSATCRSAFSAAARASISAATSLAAVTGLTARPASVSSSSEGAERSAEVRIPLNLPPHPRQYRAPSRLAVWHSPQYLVMAVSCEQMVHWKGMNSATITSRFTTRANAAKSGNAARPGRPNARARGNAASWGQASSGSPSHAA